MLYLSCGQGDRRGRKPSFNGTGAGTPGGLIAGKETARRTLTIKHNLAASIGEVCRDYANVAGQEKTARRRYNL